MTEYHPQLVDTTNSPHAALRSIPIDALAMHGNSFWQPRRERNARQAVMAFYQNLEDHGVIDNFRRVSGRSNVARKGFYWTDSDLYKWMEAAAWTLHHHPDDNLRKTLDDTIDEVLAAQGDDGYLNTWFVDRDHDERFSRMSASHEFYNLGHLLEAGIAHYRTSGQADLLRAGRRFTDYLMTVFGPELRVERPDHPELELALVELYRVTGHRPYLDFAKWLLDRLEVFDKAPITGHAVCSTYALTGAANWCLESGERQYTESMQRLWQDMCCDKIYLTGGIGVRYYREDFGFPYELPSQYGYAETCAAIGNLFWNWRLLLMTGDCRYADLLERILYNAFLAGVSLTGTEYFYQNPLAATGDYRRKDWHECTCCPPNVQRLLATLPGYFYTTDEAGLWVQLYDQHEATLRLPDGQALHLEQVTRYPWDGTITITLNPEHAATWTLRLRIPGWCREPALSVNDKSIEAPAPGTYATLRRNWQPGDRISLKLPMRPRLIQPDPRLRDAAGCLALMRGPLVYCLEGEDNPEVLSSRLVLQADDTHASLKAVARPDLLGGITTITAPGAIAPATGAALYTPWSPDHSSRPTQLTFIPYFAWANRQPSPMIVWTPWDLDR